MALFPAFHFLACFVIGNNDLSSNRKPLCTKVVNFLGALQVERNLASGAKNLFMPHELVAEQVTQLLQLTIPDVVAFLWYLPKTAFVSLLLYVWYMALHYSLLALHYYSVQAQTLSSLRCPFSPCTPRGSSIVVHAVQCSTS